jgi:hypothetical protein
MIIRIKAGEIDLEFELRRDNTTRFMVDGDSFDLGTWVKTGNELEISLSEGSVKDAFLDVLGKAAVSQDSREVLVFEEKE